MAGEWQAFGESLLKVASESFTTIGEAHKTELNQAILNDVFDEPGPRELTRRSTERELFLRRVFDGYTELLASLDAMTNAEIYLRRSPPSNSSISRVDHMKYHIQCYLNEVYILKERLNSFLTSIGREYRRDPRHAAILAETRPVFAVVKNSLDSVVDTRGKHVHSKRFSDTDLDRLGLMTLLSISTTNQSDKLSEALRPYFDSEYRRVRKKWRTSIKGNNDELKKLMDIYAQSLQKVLFPGGNNELGYPSNLRAA